MTAHRVEVYSEPADAWDEPQERNAWGWYCLDCDKEREGYRGLLAAERDADDHECDPYCGDAA